MKLTILNVCLLVCWLAVCGAFRRILLSGRTTSLRRWMQQNGGDGGGEGQPMVERSTTPARRDTCRLFLSGVIGTDPREQYLSNGNYVLNFQLAVVGHFDPVHSWEKFKHTETMWLSCEVWDNEAREHMEDVKKGAPLAGLAYLIHNKWTDKATGEERKQIKVRFSNILSKEELADMLGSSGVEDIAPLSSGGDDGFASDSGFSNDFPAAGDQTAFMEPPPTQRMSRSAPQQPRQGGSFAPPQQQYQQQQYQQSSPPPQQQYRQPQQPPQQLRQQQQQQGGLGLPF